MPKRKMATFGVDIAMLASELTYAIEPIPVRELMELRHNSGNCRRDFCAN